MNQQPHRIAVFISPHGFGHAARAVAVLDILSEIGPSCQFEIFTQVPQWFFKETLTCSYQYHSLLTDIGLIQKNSLFEDIPATSEHLNSFLPFSAKLINKWAQYLQRRNCQLVLCDISALGIAIAQRAGITSVLLENFTWDWIYQHYVTEAPELGSAITYFADYFAAVDYHIQAEPVCRYHAVDLVTAPISRRSINSPSDIHRQLGIPSKMPMVTITMGGVPWEFTFIDRLAEFSSVYFVIPGGQETKQSAPNVKVLSYNSGLYHPDLVNASAVLIGKPGYSTVAEVYTAGIPFGYVSRPHFPESKIMSAFIEQDMTGFEIKPSEFQDGSWLSMLPELLTSQVVCHPERNGASEAALFLTSLLLRGS